MKDILDQIIEDSEWISDKEREEYYKHTDVAMIFDFNLISPEQKIDLYTYLKEPHINTEGWKEYNFSLSEIILNEQLKLENDHLDNCWLLSRAGNYNGELRRYLKFQQFDDNAIQVVEEPNL